MDLFLKRFFLENFFIFSELVFRRWICGRKFCLSLSATIAISSAVLGPIFRLSWRPAFASRNFFRSIKTMMKIRWKIALMFRRWTISWKCLAKRNSPKMDRFTIDAKITAAAFAFPPTIRLTFWRKSLNHFWWPKSNRVKTFRIFS